MYLSNLTFSQGLLTDWDAQKAVWDSFFSKEALSVCMHQYMRCQKWFNTCTDKASGYVSINNGALFQSAKYTDNL